MELGSELPAPEHRRPAIQFLAALGFVVSSHPIVILDPRWLSEALGKMLFQPEYGE